MKTKLKLLMAAALLLTTFAGRSQCSAAFTIGDEGIGNILFQSSAYPQGDSITQFLWTFGDGTGDTTFQSHVFHSYAGSGTYNICLTVINPSISCIIQQCDTYSVSLCSGASQFTSTQVGFGDYSFNATANLGNGYSGTWSFSDGGTASGTSATHQFTSNGTYNACFNVAGPGCFDTTCQLINVVVCQPFNIGFTYHEVSINPYTAEFVATNPTDPTYGYQWLFSDGGASGGIGEDSTQYAFNHNGPDTVTLMVSSPSGTCVDSVKQILNIDRCNLSPNVYENSDGLSAYFNVFLSDTPQQTIISNVWNFPGGTPPGSSGASVSVTYASLGTYTATLYISTQSGCTDTLYQTFTLTPAPPPVYTIDGQILAGAHAGRATVYLVVQDSVGHLALMDSTIIYLSDSFASGAYYSFGNLQPGTYYVKAAIDPGDTDYANYLPTYYTSALSWTLATPVIINSSSDTGINIDLIEGANPGGPGFVGGYVSQGAGINLQQGGSNIFRSVGDPIADVQINLLTSADEAVAYTYTDINGHYQFSNLAYGSYQVYADQLNKIPAPIPFTLSPSDSSISSLNMSINSDSATSTGIKQVGAIDILGVYPNPVINTLEVQLSSKQEASAVIKLIDVLGRTALVNNTKLAIGSNKLELDMENLAPGVYQLLFGTNGQQLTYKVVKAK